MQIDLVHEKLCIKVSIKIKYERKTEMPFPYSHQDVNTSDRDRSLAWDDPRRSLFPHHEEFWPADVPEHVYYEQLALQQRQQKRLELTLAFFRFHWLEACNPFGKKPFWKRPYLENPMAPGKGAQTPDTGCVQDNKTQATQRPVQPGTQLSLKRMSADGCHAGCR